MQQDTQVGFGGELPRATATVTGAETTPPTPTQNQAKTGAMATEKQLTTPVAGSPVFTPENSNGAEALEGTEQGVTYQCSACYSRVHIDEGFIQFTPTKDSLPVAHPTKRNVLKWSSGYYTTSNKGIIEQLDALSTARSSLFRRM